jgi:acyl-CoA reductase-like NAD-dependent aldehyde dehydrogenase
MNDLIQVITPVEGSIYLERPYSDHAQIEQALVKARIAQQSWTHIPLSKRIEIASNFVDKFIAQKEDIALEITMQMGRPIRYTPNEVRGVEERARYMISIAEESLRPVVPAAKSGFDRYITHEPLGVVFVIAPWNYPYLTAINSIVPAILAGNTVILKHSAQTPLCAERLFEAFQEAGLPDGVFQYLHLRDEDADKMISSSDIDFVAFTGSVRVGHKVEQAASNRFIGAGLELGGKDPAYVRHDADPNFAIENVVDGAFFNSGQSCCAVERVYVHEKLFDAFVEGFVKLSRRYVLGDPTNADTTLGPMVTAAAAANVRKQMAEAIEKGAKPLIDEAMFEMSKSGTAYLAPQVFTNVDHSMSLMSEESFGPIVGIMKVRDDEEAIRLMNDSKYGLTASIWTNDLEAAKRIGERVETGTFFMNRCDYLDPALAWTGVKDSGRGCTLSSLGFAQLTRPKSYHLRTKIS